MIKWQSKCGCVKGMYRAEQGVSMLQAFGELDSSCEQHPKRRSNKYKILSLEIEEEQSLNQETYEEM